MQAGEDHTDICWYFHKSFGPSGEVAAIKQTTSALSRNPWNTRDRGPFALREGAACEFRMEGRGGY